MSYLFLWFFKITASPLLLPYLKVKAFYVDKKPRLGPKTLIISNHISMYDPLIISVLYPFKTIRVVGARQLFRMHPVLGWFFKKIGVIDTEQKGDDLSLIGRVVSLLENGRRVIIFPEGHLSRDGKLLPFSCGAAVIALQTDATIIPAYRFGKKGWLHRAKVVIGEPFLLSDRLGPDLKDPEILDCANKILSDSIEELIKYVPDKYKEKTTPG